MKEENTVYIDAIDNPISFHPCPERRVVVMVWMMMVVVVMSVVEIMLMLTGRSTHTTIPQPRVMVTFGEAKILMVVLVYIFA